MQSPCADEPVICPPTQRAFFRFGRDVLLPNVDETAQVSDLIVRTAQWGQGSTRAVEDGRFLVGYGCGGFGIYYGNLWNLGSNKNLDLLTCYNSVEQGFRGTIPLGI